MSSSEDDGVGVPSDREIVSTRTLAFPRERVFAAFLEPARLARWWGPRGFTNTIHAFDPRPGGIWRSTLHGPDGSDYANEIVFLEVLSPERLVLEHPSDEHRYVLTITLDAQGDGTRLTWRMRHATAAECARVRPFVVEGNEQNLDRLEAELGRTA
jgi:uncharacterized protein YndB with AHSA1/START domain